MKLLDLVLKPCPFCGETPNWLLIPTTTPYLKHKVYIIECKNMGCILYRTRGYRNTEELIKDWNRRS